MALDVNARRQFVIGSDSPRAYVGPGYLYSDGTLVSLPSLHPMAINDLGHIAGAALGPPARAAVSADGVIVTLPTPAGLSSAAHDIIAQDVVVGDWWDRNDWAWPYRTQAFRYVAGTLTQLATRLSRSRLHAAN